MSNSGVKEFFRFGLPSCTIWLGPQWHPKVQSSQEDCQVAFLNRQVRQELEEMGTEAAIFSIFLTFDFLASLAVFMTLQFTVN